MDTATQNIATSQPYVGQVEAYCVFSSGQIIRVLNKTEFEEIVEGDAPLSGLTGRITVAYVQVNRHQIIQALVLFYLSLDEECYCLEGWRLPLHRLADTAGRGPNLGGGRIRLASRSQCSISWHQDALWDPVTSTFVEIKKAVQSKFEFLVGHVTQDTSQVDDLKDDENLESLKRALRNDAASYRNQLQALQQEIEHQRLINERLMHKKEAAVVQADERSRVDIHALRRQNQQLEMKVRELGVVNERLHNEMANNEQVSSNEEELFHDNDAVDKEMLERMAAVDMLCVVYHPGAGHLNLTPSQLSEYLGDPIAYAAHHVSMSKADYEVWLEHHNRVRCQVCDKQIPIIADPSIFDPEVDVYCDQHKPS